MNEVLRVRLTGRAVAFLKLLQDFGHLDEEQIQEVHITLADIAGTPKESPAAGSGPGDLL